MLSSLRIASDPVDSGELIFPEWWLQNKMAAGHLLNVLSGDLFNGGSRAKWWKTSFDLQIQLGP